MKVEYASSHIENFKIDSSPAAFQTEHFHSDPTWVAPRSYAKLRHLVRTKCPYLSISDLTLEHSGHIEDRKSYTYVRLVRTMAHLAWLIDDLLEVPDLNISVQGVLALLGQGRPPRRSRDAYAVSVVL